MCGCTVILHGSSQLKNQGRSQLQPLVSNREAMDRPTNTASPHHQSISTQTPPTSIPAAKACTGRISAQPQWCRALCVRWQNLLFYHTKTAHPGTFPTPDRAAFSSKILTLNLRFVNCISHDLTTATGLHLLVPGLQQPMQAQSPQCLPSAA